MSKSNNPSCYYHPGRDAITKCRICGKLICVECKNTSPIGSNFGTSEYYYHHGLSYDICTPCFYDRKIKSASAGKAVPTILGTIFILVAIICFIFFVVFTFFVPTSGFGPTGGFEPTRSDNTFKYLSYILILPIVLFSIMGVLTLFKGAKSTAGSVNGKIAELEAKKAEFLKSVASVSSAKSRTQSKEREYCPHCGSKVNRGEKICEQCGGEL